MQYLYAIMLIGYARVSTGEQTTAAQVAALKTSGCELIFRDNASGGRWDRPELHKLLSQLRKGDVLVVWTLDRLSRSLRDVLTIMERVQERHAGFRSLKEAVDTTTPAGRMMMQMVGAFAEFERAMLKERTKAGLDAARKEGRIGGRPPKLKPHQRPAAEAQAPPAAAWRREHYFSWKPFCGIRSRDRESPKYCATDDSRVSRPDVSTGSTVWSTRSRTIACTFSKPAATTDAMPGSRPACSAGVNAWGGVSPRPRPAQYASGVRAHEPWRVDHRRHARRELEDQPHGGALLGRRDCRARSRGALPVDRS